MPTGPRPPALEAPASPAPTVRVTLGVDTHRDAHVAVALDHLGAASAPGWSRRRRRLRRAGGVGRRARGAGAGGDRGGHPSSPPSLLESHPRPTAEVHPITSRRPALPAVLPKPPTAREMLPRCAWPAGRGEGPHPAANQLHARVTPPLRGLSLARLVAAAADLEAPAAPATAQAAAEFTLRLLARRHRHLSEEIAALEAQLGRLVAEVAGALAAVQGVGPDTATALLVAAGDNPERLRSEGAFAHLCGVAPIPASSGRTQRHRLNRGGTATPIGRCTSS